MHGSAASWLDRLKVLPQYLAPQHLLSRLMFELARAEQPWLVRRLIATLRRHYAINLDEAARSDPGSYHSLNDFFTRALCPDARPLPEGDSAALVSPADGRISQRGRIDGGQLFQAKGHHYSLEALLGTDSLSASPFQGGAFATIYLAPHNYHRVHSPADCRVMEVIYVPGRLFSVNDRTARVVPGLFARNERVVLRCQSTGGSEFALVMVGAMLVGSMTLEFCDLAPLYRGRLHRTLRLGSGVPLARGAELGRFNMGSTVIMVHARDSMCWDESVAAGDEVRVNQRLGAWTSHIDKGYA